MCGVPARSKVTHNKCIYLPLLLHYQGEKHNIPLFMCVGWGRQRDYNSWKRFHLYHLTSACIYLRFQVRSYPLTSTKFHIERPRRGGWAIHLVFVSPPIAWLFPHCLHGVCSHFVVASRDHSHHNHLHGTAHILAQLDHQCILYIWSHAGKSLPENKSSFFLFPPYMKSVSWLMSQD